MKLGHALFEAQNHECVSTYRASPRAVRSALEIVNQRSGIELTQSLGVLSGVAHSSSIFPIGGGDTATTFDPAPSVMVATEALTAFAHSAAAALLPALDFSSSAAV